jgi:acetyl esterase
MPSPIPVSWLAAPLRLLYALPSPVRRVLAGRPVRIDGNELDLDLQLLLRLQRISGQDGLAGEKPASARRYTDERAKLLEFRPEPAETRELMIPSGELSLPATLYTPPGLAAGSGLLVYLHGGGFVIGSRRSHDGLVRLLANRARVRVLSVEYSLAPEHPFPQATEDALAALRYAVAEAGSLGADPAAIAIGGDSAGANLALVAARAATAEPGGPRPAYVLAIYPVTDDTTQTRSRDLFAEGFFLTSEDLAWFTEHYQADGTDHRMSILLADLTGMPPCYVSTAGFDPLRDEGDALAAKLAAAGVPVTHRTFQDLIHGYANMFSISARCRAAVEDAAAALRDALSKDKVS